jgi:hypothetical protein
MQASAATERDLLTIAFERVSRRVWTGSLSGSTAGDSGMSGKGR